MSSRDTIAGVCGATCCTYFGLPFDVAKARLQSQQGSSSGGGSLRYRGLVDCILSIVRQEGPLALYGGAAGALGSAVVENVVGVTVQRGLRRQLAESQGRGLDIADQSELRPATEVALGGVTGVFTSVAMCPFEVIKVYVQVHGTSPAGAAREVLRADGPSGLYRGLVSIVCRDVPFNAFFYGSYETICAMLMQAHGVERKEQLSFSSIFVAGGVAGSVGWSLIIPFDVVKTRLQSGEARGGTLDTMRSIVCAEGWPALFKGWTAAVVRAFPANAGLFVGVETAIRLMNRTMGEVPA